MENCIKFGQPTIKIVIRLYFQPVFRQFGCTFYSRLKHKKCKGLFHVLFCFLSSRGRSPPVPAVKHRAQSQHASNTLPLVSEFIPYVRTNEVFNLDPLEPADTPPPLTHSGQTHQTRCNDPQNFQVPASPLTQILRYSRGNDLGLKVTTKTRCLFKFKPSCKYSIVTRWSNIIVSACSEFYPTSPQNVENQSINCLTKEIFCIILLSHSQNHQTLQNRLNVSISVT